MKSIVFFCPTSTWGGVEKNVRLRIEFLLDSDYEVHLVLLRGLFRDKFDFKHKNFKIHQVSSRGGDLNFMVVNRYLKLLKQIRPHIVFSALKKDWWLVSLSAYLAGKPKVILYLGISRKISKSLKYYLLLKRLRPNILVNSHALKERICAQNNWISPQKVKVIHNGFQLPTLPKTDEVLRLRKQYNIPENAFIVGCAGRFSAQKGFDQLVDIASLTAKNIHFVHVGAGPLEHEIKSQVLHSAHHKRIHFLGGFKQSEMHAFYAVLDCFLLCSRREGMANVLNEAMSFGIPCISTKVDGSTELLENGKRGILVEINDVPNMAKSITDLCENRIKFASEALRNHIDEHYSLGQMIQSTLEFFEA